MVSKFIGGRYLRENESEVDRRTRRPYSSEPTRDDHERLELLSRDSRAMDWFASKKFGDAAASAAVSGCPELPPLPITPRVPEKASPAAWRLPTNCDSGLLRQGP